MGKYYTPDFKLEAVKRVQRTGEPVSKVAESSGDQPEGPFPGIGRLSPEGDWLRKLEWENRDLKESEDLSPDSL